MNTETYRTANESAVWRDMSHWGRIAVVGRDAGALLHHLTTNDIKGLRPGQSCDAALISSKARMLDLLTVFRRDADYLVLTSPNRREMFVPHAQKFVLYRQDVRFAEVTTGSAMFGLFGRRLEDALGTLNIELPEAVDAFAHFASNGVEFYAMRTRRLPGDGVLLWSDDAQGLRRLVENSNSPLCDNETYNVLRVEAGVPATGLELTEAINPWEAGLDNAISLHKGCYNGQEIVARLNTYKKVKQGLQGLRLSEPLGAEAATLKVTGKDAGSITSSVHSPRFGPIALAYVRGDFQSAGQQLEVVADENTQTATVTTVPFSDI